MTSRHSYSAATLLVAAILLLVSHNSSNGQTGPFPNPFTVVTIIPLSVPPPGADIAVDIYNIRGEHVKNLFPGGAEGESAFHPPGDYSIVWDGTDRSGEVVVDGVYLVVLSDSKSVLSTVKLVRMGLSEHIPADDELSRRSSLTDSDREGGSHTWLTKQPGMY